MNIESPALQDRVAAALGLEAVPNAGTFGSICREARREVVVKGLRIDPFGDTTNNFASRCCVALLDSHPELADLPFSEGCFRASQLYGGLFIDWLVFAETGSIGTAT